MTEGYSALRRGAAWLDLGARGRIGARGRDSARFLHNLTSNEIKKLTPGAGCYAFLLSPQGRIQADVNVLCLDGRFLLDTEPETREKVRLHLKRYIVADQVELEDLTDQTASVGLEGPTALAVLAAAGISAPAEDYAHLQWEDSTVAALSFTGQPGVRIFCPAALKSAIVGRLEAAGATASSSEDARLARIGNGKPRYGEDILETSLPQETRQMHAVSFTKGCYLGQEIVERIRARGHVNRVLARFEIDADAPPAAGSKLMHGESDAGEITSSILSPESGKVAALGYVRTQFSEPGTALKIGEWTAVVV